MSVMYLLNSNLHKVENVHITLSYQYN